ncbi:MAG: diaminopimelate decarboxylase [Candidatus Eutrophobiaceae bacterium]
MGCLTHREGEMCMEGASLAQIAERFGTPCYVYSRALIEANWQAYADALGGAAHSVCYAVKANSNLAILNLLALRGSGFDIVSIGELRRVEQAGGRADKVVFSGVGKTRHELVHALDAGIRCFNVESAAELEALSAIALERGVTAPISLRVNPDVDPKTHPYIATGLKESKFGIDIDLIAELVTRARALGGVDIVGVGCHIGSQITELSPFKEAAEHMCALIGTLESQGEHIRHVDMGGGLGVSYQGEELPAVAEYIAVLRRIFGEREVLVEPGRSIVASAGVLLTRVEYLKSAAAHDFAIVDAAMNDFIRPMLYSGWHDVQRVSAPPIGTKTKSWNIAGPICESADILAKQRELVLEQGDVLAITDVGAYGFVMGGNYNSRPRPCEVLVDGDQIHEIRRRETLEDLWRGEHCLGNEYA